MKSLEKQYIEDTITSEELESLRCQVDNQTDEELFKDLQAQWMDDDNAGTADADAFPRVGHFYCHLMRTVRDNNQIGRASCRERV